MVDDAVEMNPASVERSPTVNVEVAFTAPPTVSRSLMNTSPCTARSVPGEVVPMPIRPKGDASVEMVKTGVFVVDVAMLHAFVKRLGIVVVAAPENASVDVAKLIVPAFIVTTSPEASPRVVLFSTMREAIVVAPTVTEPSVVREFAKMSPSASTMNLALSFTAMPKRFVSAAADAGFTTNGASSTAAAGSSTAQTLNVCASDGAREAIMREAKVEVALSPPIVVVAVPPMKSVSKMESRVVDACMNIDASDEVAESDETVSVSKDADVPVNVPVRVPPVSGR